MLTPVHFPYAMLNKVMTWDDHDTGLNDGGASNPYKVVAKRLAAQFYHMQASP